MTTRVTFSTVLRGSDGNATGIQVTVSPMNPRLRAMLHAVRPSKPRRFVGSPSSQGAVAGSDGW